MVTRQCDHVNLYAGQCTRRPHRYGRHSNGIVEWRKWTDTPRALPGVRLGKTGRDTLGNTGHPEGMR